MMPAKVMRPNRRPSPICASAVPGQVPEPGAILNQALAGVGTERGKACHAYDEQ